MDYQVGTPAGFAAANVGGGTNRSNLNGGATDAPQAGYWDTDLVSVASLRAKLVANAAYPAAILDQMTYNDMVYAVRLLDSPGTIRQ